MILTPPPPPFARIYFRLVFFPSLGVLLFARNACRQREGGRLFEQEGQAVQEVFQVFLLQGFLFQGEEKEEQGLRDARRASSSRDGEKAPPAPTQELSLGQRCRRLRVRRGGVRGARGGRGCCGRLCSFCRSVVMGGGVRTVVAIAGVGCVGICWLCLSGDHIPTFFMLPKSEFCEEQ